METTLYSTLLIRVAKQPQKPKIPMSLECTDKQTAST